MKTFHIVLLSLLVFTISAFSGALGSLNSFFINGLLFFVVVVLVKKYTKKSAVLFWVLAPTILILLATGIHAAVIGPARAIMIPLISILSVLVGLFIHSSEYRNTLSAIYIIILIPLSYVGYSNWINYVYDNENPIHIEFPKDLILKDDSGKIYDLSKDKGRVIVLDLWSTSCRVCIEEFPNYEKQMIKYKNDPDVKFYSVNLGLRRDSTINVSNYVKDYTFKTLYANDDSWEILKNRSVPKLLILDKNFNIVYKGLMYDEWYHFYQNFNSIINKLKNEQV